MDLTLLQKKVVSNTLSNTNPVLVEKDKIGCYCPYAGGQSRARYFNQRLDLQRLSIKDTPKLDFPGKSSVHVTNFHKKDPRIPICKKNLFRLK